MLASLKNLLSEQFSLDTANDADNTQHALGVATAALAMDIARVDNSFDEAERRHIIDAISRQFSFSEEETKKLIELADDKLEQSVSLHDFTRALNNSLDRDEKIQIVRLLWDVAWADNKLDKYEEYFIRKMADLLYVSHADYIRVKLAAEEARQAV